MHNVQQKDIIRHFLIKNQQVRGKIIIANEQFSQIITRHNYPHNINKILLQAMMLGCLFASDLKKDGIITLQLKSQNPAINFMVVDVNDKMEMRACVDLVSDNLDKKADFSELFLGGRLIITVDMGEGYKRYQSITELSKPSLEQCLIQHIMSTEQIPTSIKLLQIETNKRYEGAVIMLQHIPQVSTTSFNNQRWNELKILTDTLQIKEVTNPNLTENNLLHRLYNEYEIMIFENRKIYDKCRCSHLRALNVLRALSKDEIEKLKIDGKVIVKCQYCLKENIFEDL